MNAILKYPGSKWKIADWIISYFPTHKVYLEPFFGSGAIFFNKESSYIETINDIDSNIVNLFEVCRQYPDELSAAINLTPYSREEFAKCYEKSDNPIEQARRTLVRYHQSFGTSNSTRKSWRNVQQFNGPRTATMWNYLPDTVIEVCERLKEAQIENTDALTLIERYNDENTLIYIDPPYLKSLRRRNMYHNEMSVKQHKDLLDLIKSSKAKIILSSYDNELYNTELREWCTAETKAFAQFGKSRTEKLWMNFDSNLNLFHMQENSELI